MGNYMFSKLAEDRKSANNFIEGVEITKNDFNEIFKDVVLAPSCFNLQHVKYLIISDKDKKDEFKEKACSQYKLHSASAAILVLGDREAYKNVDKIYEPMKWLGMMDNTQYVQTLDMVKNFYESRGIDFKKDEAIRNASLSAMMFMLSAKDKGWDTCPMIGFDKDIARELFSIDDKYEIVMLITIGKEDPNNKRLRGYRKPIDEFVQYV